MSEMPPQKKMRSTTKTPPPPPPPLRLAGYRLDPSPLGMIRLLYLKNRENVNIFLDPSVEGNVYKLPPWLIIGAEDEPQFSDTFEYLIYNSQRHLIPPGNPCDLDSVRRKLQGEADVLFWKMNGSPTKIIDRLSEAEVGTVTHFSLCVTGREDVKLHWYLTEYVSSDSQSTSLCKLRMESDSLKKLRAEVKRCGKELDSKLSDHQLVCHRERSSLPDDHRLCVDLVKARDDFSKAKALLQQEVCRLRDGNVRDFNRILGRETLLKPAPLAFDVLLNQATLALSDPLENTLEVVYDDDGFGRFRVRDGARCIDSFRCFPV